MLKAALAYAETGWYVVLLHEPLFDAQDSQGKPTSCTCEEYWRYEGNERRPPDATFTCPTPGKHPVLGDWEGKATTDEAEIKRLWRWKPTANVGIAAGKSGLVCVDKDTYHEVAEGGELTFADRKTVTNLTGGGGEHLIYRHPDEGPEISNSDSNLPEWVNIRAHGGQFVAPPSMHPSGRRYAWEVDYGPHEQDPAPLPEALRDLLQSAAKKPAAPVPDGPIPKGKRHPTLVSLAGTMRRRGMSEPAMVAALLKENERCDPPKPEREVRDIAEWAAKQEPEDPVLNGQGPDGDDEADSSRRGTKDALTAEYRAVLRRLLDSPPQMNAMDNSVWVDGELLTDGLAAKIDNDMRDEGFTNSQRIRNVYIGWAYENQFHPVRDYLDKLTWDGGDHHAWHGQYMTFGPAYQTDDPDRPWAYWYIKRWMIGAVAKAYEATQNFCLVLDGPQGIGKSYWTRWLCPPELRDYFSEAHYQAGNKDSRLEQMRTWIWELPELQAVTRKSDREELKHGISRLWITERPPYGRYPIRKPNLTSFVGTINESGAGFLNDPTGHRRFVVVKLESIDWDYDDVIDVDQLWAQAVAAYKQGDPWQLTAEEQAKQRLINEGYETSSPLAEMFYTHYRIDRNNKLWMPAMTIIRDLEELGLKGNQWVMLQELAELMQKEGVSKGRPRLEVDGEEKKKQVTAYQGVVQR